MVHNYTELTTDLCGTLLYWADNRPLVHYYTELTTYLCGTSLYWQQASVVHHYTDNRPLVYHYTDNRSLLYITILSWQQDSMILYLGRLLFWDIAEDNFLVPCSPFCSKIPSLFQVTWMPTVLFHSAWHPTSQSFWRPPVWQGRWRPPWLPQRAAWCSPSTSCSPSCAPFWGTSTSHGTKRCSLLGHYQSADWCSLLGHYQSADLSSTVELYNAVYSEVVILLFWLWMYCFPSVGVISSTA